MARYTDGDWYAVVSSAGIALLPPTVPTETAEAIWSELGAGKGLAAVLDGLVGSFGTSLSSLPDFAALVPDGMAGARVAMRGAVEAQLWTADASEPVVVSGQGVTTWSERAVPAVQRAVVFVQGVSGMTELPISDGIVRSSRLTLVGLDGATQPEPVRLVEPIETPTEPEPVGLIEPIETLPEPEPVGPVEPQPVGPVEPEPVGPIEPIEAPVELDPLVESVETLAEPETPPQVEPPAEWTEAQRHADTLIAAEEPNEYDQLLFGDTVLSSVEAAAVREEEADGATTAAGWMPPAEFGIGVQPPVAAAPLPQPPVGSMIAGIPGFADAAAPQQLGDHDGETVSVEQLRAMLAGRDQPSVQPEAPPALTRYATMLVPGLAPLRLDRGAIVGTRPKLSRVQGGNAPHLVTVTSPSSEISRSHVEIRVEGTTLLAVDLNSTNGTMLLRRGVDPVRLQPGEPSILVPGDRVDLGDGVVLDFEGLA